MHRCIFLDRDNTIIHNDDHLGNPDGVILFEDVPASLQALHDAGWLLVVVTNQPIRMRCVLKNWSSAGSGTARRGQFTKN